MNHLYACEPNDSSVYSSHIIIIDNEVGDDDNETSHTLYNANIVQSSEYLRMCVF